MGKHLDFSKISETNNCYFIDGVRLTNFVLKPKRYEIRKYLSDDGTVSSETHLVFMNVLFCQRPDEVQKIVFDLNTDTRGNSVLKKLLPGCLITLSDSIQANLIHRIIFDAIEELTPQIINYCEKQGYFKINGTPYYNLCNITLSATKENTIRSSCGSHILPYSEPRKCMEWLNKYMNAVNFEPLLLLSAFAPYSCHLIKTDSGDDRRFVTFIKAPTSTGKTTHMELIVKISDDNYNMFSLSSDRKGLNLMSEIDGVPMLIDDFNKTRSDSIYRANTKKLSDMVGQFQSPTMRVIDEKEVGLKVGFFVTVEELIDNPSTINRGIVAELPGPFDSEQMTWLQENKGLYIGLIVLFIKYLLVKEDELKRTVASNRTFIRNDTVDSNNYVTDHKILKTRETLMLTKILLLEFLKDCFKPEQQYIDELGRKFTDSINDCVKRTFELAKREAEKEGTEYVDAIAKLVFETQSVELSRITNDIRRYKNHHIINYLDEGVLPKIIGLYDKNEDCVCFKTDDLLLYFQNQDMLKSKPTVKSIIKQLDYHRLLKYVGAESTYPLSKNKHLGRFIHIYRRNLYALFRRNCADGNYVNNINAKIVFENESNDSSETYQDWEELQAEMEKAERKEKKKRKRKIKKDNERLNKLMK